MAPLGLSHRDCSVDGFFATKKKGKAIGVSEMRKALVALRAVVHAVVHSVVHAVVHAASSLPSFTFLFVLLEGKCGGHEIGMCLIMKCFAVFVRTHTKKTVFGEFWIFFFLGSLLMLIFSLKSLTRKGQIFREPLLASSGSSTSSLG